MWRVILLIEYDLIQCAWSSHVAVLGFASRSPRQGVCMYREKKVVSSKGVPPFRKEGNPTGRVTPLA